MLNYLIYVKPEFGKEFLRSLEIHPNQVLLQTHSSRVLTTVKPGSTGYGENLVWVNHFKSPSLYRLMLNYLTCVKPDLGKGFFRSLAIHPNQVLLYITMLYQCTRLNTCNAYGLCLRLRLT